MHEVALLHSFSVIIHSLPTRQEKNYVSSAKKYPLERELTVLLLVVSYRALSFLLFSVLHQEARTYNTEDVVWYSKLAQVCMSPYFSQWTLLSTFPSRQCPRNPHVHTESKDSLMLMTIHSRKLFFS
jgi:hypothetical protein